MSANKRQRENVTKDLNRFESELRADARREEESTGRPNPISIRPIIEAVQNGRDDEFVADLLRLRREQKFHVRALRAIERLGTRAREVIAQFMGRGEKMLTQKEVLKRAANTESTKK